MSKKASTVLSHWYHLVENLQHSPQEFYSALEEAIKRRQLTDSSLSRVDYLEGGILSAKREYLRVQRQKQLFDVCAAPYGNGFFVSWWLVEASSSAGVVIAVSMLLAALLAYAFLINSFGFFVGLLLGSVAMFLLLIAFVSLVHDGTIAVEDSVMELPLLGRFYELLFNPVTYYKIDTTLMFQESIRSAVQETLDQVTQAKGLRSLTESERKPILNDLLKR